jgi:hypothetical protein
MAHAMQRRFETEEPGSGRVFLREQRAEASAHRSASTGVPFAELAFDGREPGHSDPRGRYPPRRRAGLKVSGSFERPLGQTTGPRLKRAPGSLQGLSAFKAEP